MCPNTSPAHAYYHRTPVRPGGMDHRDPDTPLSLPRLPMTPDSWMSPPGSSNGSFLQQVCYQGETTIVFGSVLDQNKNLRDTKYT